MAKPDKGNHNVHALALKCDGLRLMLSKTECMVEKRERENERLRVGLAEIMGLIESGEVYGTEIHRIARTALDVPACRHKDDERAAECADMPAQMEPHEVIALFLLDMRASGSWDVRTLDRAIEVALNVCGHATRSTQAGRDAIASVTAPDRS